MLRRGNLVQISQNYKSEAVIGLHQGLTRNQPRGWCQSRCQLPSFSQCPEHLQIVHIWHLIQYTYRLVFVVGTFYWIRIKFLAKSTMEDKIYNRQASVVDEQQIERHYTRSRSNQAELLLLESPAWRGLARCWPTCGPVQVCLPLTPQHLHSWGIFISIYIIILYWFIKGGQANFSPNKTNHFK